MAEHDILKVIPQSYKAIKEQSEPIRNANELREKSLTLTDRIALTATGLVGTMGFMYVCMIMVMIPLLLPKTLPVVQYISSGFLQLILLPLIMVGQNLQGRHTEIRAENDYQVNLKAEREIANLFRHLEYQNAILLALMKKLDVHMEDVLAISAETEAMVNEIVEQPQGPESKA